MSNMLFLSLPPLSNRAARSASCCHAQRGERARARHALRLLYALLLILLLGKMAAALPLSRYEMQVHEAVVKLTALAKDEGSAEHVTKTLNEVRNLVPAEETVEWEGGTVRVNNSWLEAELQTYEKMPPDDPHRDDALARIVERLSALEDRLADLSGQRKIANGSTESSASKNQKVLRKAAGGERDQSGVETF